MELGPSLYLLYPRCPSCGSLLGNKQLPLEQLLREGHTLAEAMDILGIRLYCCRYRVISPITIPVGSPLQYPHLQVEPHRSTSLPGALTAIQNSTSINAIPAQSATEELTSPLPPPTLLPPIATISLPRREQLESGVVSGPPRGIIANIYRAI